MALQAVACSPAPIVSSRLSEISVAACDDAMCGDAVGHGTILVATTVRVRITNRRRPWRLRRPLRDPVFTAVDDRIEEGFGARIGAHTLLEGRLRTSTMGLRTDRGRPLRA